jgi:histidinol-phosphate phosphatase family protein
MKPLLVLDRDGVLNELIYDSVNGRAPRAVSEIKYLLRFDLFSILAEKFSITCVTNQPDISIGKVSHDEALNVHNKIMQNFGIRNSFMCIHSNEMRCGCRKPETLMLHMAEKSGYFEGDVTIVGDRWTDILAGNKLGWRTALLERDEFTMSKTSQGGPPHNLPLDIRARSWDELIEALTG